MRTTFETATNTAPTARVTGEAKGAATVTVEEMKGSLKKPGTAPGKDDRPPQEEATPLPTDPTKRKK